MALEAVNIDQEKKNPAPEHRKAVNRSVQTFLFVANTPFSAH